ncbi:MAG: glycosyl transferase family protein [Acetobacteraceae bacterium]|nr:glycosyl transferase family protein [Acetobacteraceae bacterium]
MTDLADPGAMPARVDTDTHDFAPFVRILGRGPGKSRSFTRDEAKMALGMVLRGEATREQIGAMLMLLRYRGEAADEMAGLVEAARLHAGLPWRFARRVDLDWPSYADGRTRGLPWYLLSALLLAGAGLHVLMHGPLTGPGRQALVQSMQALGLSPQRTPEQIECALTSRGFAFVSLETLNPELADLLALRGVLGLRSPLNTACRLLDPAGACASVDGVFHPAYIELHLGAGTLLGRRVSVLKGGGGEAEWSGLKALTVSTTEGETVWQPLASGVKVASQNVADLVAVWRGENVDPGAEAAIIGTAAIALRARDAGLSVTAALAEARRMWAKR